MITYAASPASLALAEAVHPTEPELDGTQPETRNGPGPRDRVPCLRLGAWNPGGGFLTGAQAQEESIARSSALYASQRVVPAFYEHHCAERSLLYSDCVIVSSAVPIFQSDDGALLAAPYLVTFLTAAAPNRGAVARNQPEALPLVAVTFARRAARVLDVAAAHGCRRLVLGAWGCGVFGNDPAEAAATFGAVLAERAGWFDHAVFAVLDRDEHSPTRAAFVGLATAV